MRRVVLALVSLAFVLTGCYTPPTFVVPTEPPTTTPVAGQRHGRRGAPELDHRPHRSPSRRRPRLPRRPCTSRTPASILRNASNSSVTLTNGGSSNVDLGGWTLLVANYRVALPKTNYMTVAPGSSLIVHLATSQTPTNGQNVYVGLGSLDNTPRANPDQIVLLDPNGQVASQVRDA